MFKFWSSAFEYCIQHGFGAKDIWAHSKVTGISGGIWKAETCMSSICSTNSESSADYKSILIMS